MRVLERDELPEVEQMHRRMSHAELVKVSDPTVELGRYRALPNEVRDFADQAYALLKKSSPSSLAAEL